MGQHVVAEQSGVFEGFTVSDIIWTAPLADSSSFLAVLYGQGYHRDTVQKNGALRHHARKESEDATHALRVLRHQLRRPRDMAPPRTLEGTQTPRTLEGT